MCHVRQGKSHWAKFGCGMCEDVCVVPCNVACCEKKQVCVCVMYAREIPLTVDESFGIIESRLADGAQYNVIWSQEQQS